jgi:hypothetical protein
MYIQTRHGAIAENADQENQEGPPTSEIPGSALQRFHYVLFQSARSPKRFRSAIEIQEWQCEASLLQYPQPTQTAAGLREAGERKENQRHDRRNTIPEICARIK